MNGRGDIISADMPYIATDVDRLILSYQDRDPNNFSVERHRVDVRNGRLKNEVGQLDVRGFFIETFPSEVVRSRRDELIFENAEPRDDSPPVNDAYSAELIDRIKTLSGARDVIPQYGTTTVRFSNRAAHRSWLTTASFAHLDFNPEQVEKLIADTLEVTQQEIKPYSRHVVYQTWRVITDPPQDMPLALCDGRSVSLKEIIPMDFHGPEGSRNALIKSRVAKYDPRHEWYYFPEMTIDEVLIFKGFDSTIPDGTNALHTSFDDESVADAVPRGSIECRFMAFYD